MLRAPILTVLLACGVMLSAATVQAQEEGLGRPIDLAARHREFCTDHLAHKAGRLAYLAAKLNPTANQKPLWDRYYQSVMSSARSEEQSCLQSPAPAPDVHPTILEHQSHEVRMLQARLEAMQSSEPALSALYQALTPEQKAVLDEPHHHGFASHGMRGHGMMDGEHGHHDGPMGDQSYH